MDIRKVKKLIEMLEASNLEEIEIQEGEESVRLVKKQTETLVTHQDKQNQLNQIAEKTVTEHSQEVSPTKKNASDEVINSPMVGTFYAATSPGAKPFVSVGDVVEEGDVVCIVEAKPKTAMLPIFIGSETLKSNLNLLVIFIFLLHLYLLMQ